LRLGLDYYSEQNAQYTLGYGWIRSYQYGEQPIAHDNNEHRKHDEQCIAIHHELRIITGNDVIVLARGIPVDMLCVLLQ
jgi:hypothetical protein